MATKDADVARDRAWVVPASAVAFAVLFVFGLLTAGGANDTQDKTDDEIVKLFHDNKTITVVGAYALVLAGLAFLPLAWAVARRVGAGLSTLGEQLARGTAVLFVAMVLVAAAAFASLAGGVAFGSLDDPSADLIRFVPQIGFGALLIAGALSVSLFLAIVSRAGQTTGAVPKWFWILGYVAAVAMLAGVMFLPMPTLPIWAIAAAFVLKGEPAPQT